MAPNSCSFENFEDLHFHPFHNESFSDPTQKMRETQMKLNTQNFECSYLFPYEIKSFHSEKENSETINAIHVNIRRFVEKC